MEEGMDRIKAAAYAWSHTAAPMLAGTLVTVVGLMPVGFASSSAGEYAGNIFWIVGFALIASWVVAVAFTPYLGVALLPKMKPVPAGTPRSTSTPNYRRLRAAITWSVRRKFLVAGVVVAAFVSPWWAWARSRSSFSPTSDRPEVLVEVQMPEGASIEATAAAVQGRDMAQAAARSEIVTSYIGQGAPRFFFAITRASRPLLRQDHCADPRAEAREALKPRLRRAIADGLAPEARLRVPQLVFGPSAPFPVMFRVMGPDPGVLRGIADQVQAVMRANPDMRQVNRDWGERAPSGISSSIRTACG